MDKEKIARYLNAGYTHWVGYEAYLPLAECWIPSGFPTTNDALFQHEAACERRAKYGEIRNWSIRKLEV